MLYKTTEELLVYTHQPPNTKRQVKSLIPSNGNCFLGRWKHPLPTVYSIDHSYHSHYFSLPPNNPSFMRNISASQYSLNVLYLINSSIFMQDKLYFNCALNLFNMETLQVYEGQIITSFYIDDHDIIDNLVWDIYVYIYVYIYIYISFI